MSDMVTNNNLTQTYSKQQAADDARTHLLSTFNGVLSTIMRDNLGLDGYPFGSVVPFCLSQSNEIIVLISDIAQHTKNININPKVSITLHNIDQYNIQKGWRLTVIGEAKKVTSEEAEILAQRYERYFADSRDYHRVHDFNFYIISPKKGRYINGFGEIHWVDFERMIQPSIFDVVTENEMITHMNEDHNDALLLFMQTKMEVTHPEKIRLVQIDQYGFTIAHDERFERFTFKEEAKSPMDIRLFLVEMVQRIRMKLQ